MKKKYSEEFYLKRFQEVVAFLTAVGIKKHFHSIDAYKRAANSSRAYHLTIEWDILQKLTTLHIDGKLRKRFEDFVGRSADLFTYHRHCHKTYSSSDKHFARNAFFELSDKVLEDYFSTPDNFNTKTCHFLSREAHRFIDKHVYNFTAENNKEDNMTKAEKEKLKKECDEGKHGLAYEYLVKQAEKKEKQNLKTLHTRIMNLTQKAMFEIVEENKRLKEENERLTAENKQLRDLNSDIPKEEEKQEEKKEEEHKISFDEYCDLINAADDPGTFTYNIPEERLSEDCKKQCIEGSLLDDDIPEEDDDEDAADKLEAARHAKLEAIARTLAELENQKKSAARPPEDDIPEVPEEKHYSKVIPRLQEFVNKCYISKREAERFAAIAKEKIVIKESRTGFSTQDRDKSKSARETIMRHFVSEYQSMMDDKDWKWAKMFTI